MQEEIREEKDYRLILKEELARRCEANARYSLRAFARDLKISPSRLCNVLNGKFGLSGEAAVGIAQSLGMNDQETAYFRALVESEHARGSVKKRIAKEKLKKNQDPYCELNLDHFKVIADWYHLAIMELTRVEGFQDDLAWIAKRLNISPYEAELAVDRLLRLELLERSRSGLKNTGSYFTNKSGIPSASVRRFHHQVLLKAQSSLEFQGTDEREFQTFTLAIDPADLPRAKDRIRKFTNELNQELAGGDGKKEVYHFSTQFFSSEKSPIQNRGDENEK